MGLFAAGNKLLAADLNALPQVVDSTATSATSASSSGSVQAFDTGLGNVTIVADGSTQYDIEMTNATVAPTLAGDHFTIRIQDGGVAAPTTAVPGATVASCSYLSQGTSGLGQEGRNPRNRFTPTAGTHIFGVSYQRDVTGSGTMQLTGDRQLIVRTAGPA